jgi:creatinine amidohydrolase
MARNDRNGRTMTAPSGRVIGELTFQDVSRLDVNSILCLPLGSIEQHGPHLPLNTDAVLAQEFARRIIARWGDALDLWQLPLLTYGLSREHDWAAGTLSLSISSMIALLRNLACEIVRALPARNLAAINCHGGNRGILEAVVQEWRAEFGLNVCILHPTTLAEGATDTALPDLHAGKNETSMMLAIAPHLVRQDLSGAAAAPRDSDRIRSKILDPGVTWPWTTDDPALASAGVIGDARTASREFGERLIERAVSAAGPILQALRAKQVPGKTTIQRDP